MTTSAKRNAFCINGLGWLRGRAATFTELSTASLRDGGAIHADTTTPVRGLAGGRKLNRAPVKRRRRAINEVLLAIVGPDLQASRRRSLFVPRTVGTGCRVVALSAERDSTK